MIQKINPHPAPGCNRSPPPTMYFQKMQFLGVFRPFLKRSLSKTLKYAAFSNTSFFWAQKQCISGGFFTVMGQKTVLTVKMENYKKKGNLRILQKIMKYDKIE